MDRPLNRPGLAAVFGCFPAPIEFAGADVLEDHPLKKPGAIAAGGFAGQNHLAVFELADEIQICALIVDPGLFPFAGGWVEQ